MLMWTTARAASSERCDHDIIQDLQKVGEASPEDVGSDTCLRCCQADSEHMTFRCAFCLCFWHRECSKLVASTASSSTSSTLPRRPASPLPELFTNFEPEAKRPSIAEYVCKRALCGPCAGPVCVDHYCRNYSYYYSYYCHYCHQYHYYRVSPAIGSSLAWPLGPLGPIRPTLCDLCMTYWAIPTATAALSAGSKRSARSRRGPAARVCLHGPRARTLARMRTRTHA